MVLPHRYQRLQNHNKPLPKGWIYPNKAILIKSLYISNSLQALGAEKMYIEGLDEGDVLMLTPELQYRFKRMIHNAPGAFDGVKWSIGFRDTHPVLGPLSAYLSYEDGVLKCAAYTWWHGIVPIPFPSKREYLWEPYKRTIPSTIEKMRESLQDFQTEEKELIKKWVSSVGGYMPIHKDEKESQK